MPVTVQIGWWIYKNFKINQASKVLWVTEKEPTIAVADIVLSTCEEN